MPTSTASIPASSFRVPRGNWMPRRWPRRPATGPSHQRAEIDQWLLSELHQTLADVVQRMDAYDNFGACTQINAFVDALSNWYVRRNRDRFWSGDEQSADKLDAYWTLYECLLTLSKMIAPFVPVSWPSPCGRTWPACSATRAVESVHLCDYPLADPALIDGVLSERMQLLREIASLGRSARMNAKLKVRQPLALVEVILASDTHQAWLEAHHELLREELNVKEIAYTTRGREVHLVSGPAELQAAGTARREADARRQAGPGQRRRRVAARAAARRRVR